LSSSAEGEFCPLCGDVHVSPQATYRVALGITCPNDAVICEISTAYYGTPTGSCFDGFANGTCDAPEAYDIVSSLCLGQKSCSIEIESSFFNLDAGFCADSNDDTRFVMEGRCCGGVCSQVGSQFAADEFVFTTITQKDDEEQPNHKSYAGIWILMGGLFGCLVIAAAAVWRRSQAAGAHDDPKQFVYFDPGRKDDDAGTWKVQPGSNMHV